MDIAGFIKENWAVIAEAPWVFVAALLIGWAVGRFMYGQRIETLKSRIDHKNDEITSLRERIQGKLPIRYKNEVFPGGPSKFMLSETPADANSLVVSFGGIRQGPNNYKLDGRCIDFGEPTPENCELVVNYV